MKFNLLKALIVLATTTTIVESCKNNNDANKMNKAEKRTDTIEVDTCAYLQKTIKHNNYPVRHLTRTIYFRDKIWLIGGLDTKEGYLNDIWVSEDARNWERIIPEGKIFSPRASHELVVFKDKLWLIGGSVKRGYKPYNDVWNTSDGIHWKKISGKGNHLPEISSFSVAVFHDELWLSGGSTSDGFSNEVWKSKDGKYWKQVSPYNEIFSKRLGHQMVVFKDTLWVMGGANGNDRYDDIWWTADGFHWNEVDPEKERFSNRYDHQSFVFKEKLVVLAGFGIMFRDSDLWESKDGMTWKEAGIIEGLS